MIRTLPAVLLLAACAAGTAPADAPGERLPELGPNPDALDHSPGRRTLGAGGVWEAVVAEGGSLATRRAGRVHDTVQLDTEVDHRVALAADGTLVYARRGDLVETDLWIADLAHDAKPRRVTAWTGSEDRPVLSPDGRRLAFVSGRTGIASWWVASLDTLPVPEDAAIQLTNVGVKRGRPGHAPAGFVPPPDGTTYAWTADGLAWVAEGRAYTVAVP